MKAIKRETETTTVHGVLLYVEDFLAIVDLLKENCDVVDIALDGFTLDGQIEAELDELRKKLNRSTVFDLKVSGFNFHPGWGNEDEQRRSRCYPPVAELSLAGKRVFGFEHGSLDHDAGDLKAKGLSTEILKLLRYRNVARFRREHPVLVGAFWADYYGFLPITLGLIGYRLSGSRTLLVLWDLAYLTAAFLAILHVLNSLRGNEKPVLLLERRAERQTFFSRNKEQLAIIVITALITSVLSVAGTLLVQWLHPTSSIHADKK